MTTKKKSNNQTTTLVEQKIKINKRPQKNGKDPSNKNTVWQKPPQKKQTPTTPKWPQATCRNTKTSKHYETNKKKHQQLITT